MPTNQAAATASAVDAAEQIAAHIQALAYHSNILLNGRLKKDAVIILLHDMTGIGKRDIARVLDALPQLSARYLKSQPQGRK